MGLEESVDVGLDVFLGFASGRNVICESVWSGVVGCRGSGEVEF